MPYTTATARSSAPLKFYKGGYSFPSGKEHRPASSYQHSKLKAPNVKSGKTPSQYHYHYHPRHNVHHTLSPPSGTLLERIGGSARDVDEVAEPTPCSDRIDEDSWGLDFGSDSEIRFPTPPHLYTPEPREVEEFLDSVIDALPASPSISGAEYACSVKPALALETLNHSTENTSSSVLYSPTQTTMDSLSSPISLVVNHHHHHRQSPPLGATAAMIPPASTSTIEECRKRLVPILIASAQTRDSGRNLESEQCLRLLSDDHCQNFFRQAKEMKHQLLSLATVSDGNGGSLNECLKRSRVDEVDTWIRSTRGRFDSDANVSVASDTATAVSTSSNITLVDGIAGGAASRKWPPNLSPRSQAVLPPNSWLPYSAGQVLPLVASPVSIKDHHHTPGAFELFHQIPNMYPALVPDTTSQPKTEPDALDVSVEQPGSEQSLDHSDQAIKVTPTATFPSSTVFDFVSHRPTEPGIWFRKRGTQYKEIVDIDIEVNDETFYITKEREPFRLRKHLRLCSFPIESGTPNGNESEATITATVTDASLQDVVGHAPPPRWPRKGKLVVQVNPESERSKTWLPHTLESNPIDVTSCMRPGKNTFRFIQLSDLSSFSFVLVASAPPREEEEWRSWDWESFVERPHATLSSLGGDNTDEDENVLSEFARIPVTVRS